MRWVHRGIVGVQRGTVIFSSDSRVHLLINLPIDEEDEERWCLWRPDHAGFDSRSIFDGALVEE